MEGYFPVEKYCELTGVSRDTAYHRAIRGTIDGFKNKHNRWFLYFCDESDHIPEGFIHPKAYASMHGVTLSAILTRIRKGMFDEGNICRIRRLTPKGLIKEGTYIRKDAKFLDKREYLLAAEQNYIMNLSRPIGYLTVSEWSERENVPKYKVYSMIKYHKIPSCKNFDHWYIHGSIHYEGKGDKTA